MTLPSVLSEDYKSRWVQNQNIDAYHQDPTAISSGGIRSALKSLRYFRYCCDHPEPERKSKAKDFGGALHLALLEPKEFKRRYIVEPNFGDQRFKINREAKKEWLGQVPIDSVLLSEDERDKMLYMIESLLSNKDAVEMIRGAAFELSGYFRDSLTGLKCRIRPDIFRSDLSVLPDLKTSRNAAPDYFAKDIWNYRYDIQLGFYAYGIEQIEGKPPKEACFIVVENEPPFDTCIYTADNGMMDRAETTIKHVLRGIKKGVEKNVWPGYQRGATKQFISLPAWTDGIEDYGESL